MIQILDNDKIKVTHFVPHDRAVLSRYKHLDAMLQRFKKGDTELLVHSNGYIRYKLDGVVYEFREMHDESS